MLNRTAPFPLRVRCRICGVLIGERCLTAHGKVRELFHSQRCLDAAIEVDTEQAGSLVARAQAQLREQHRALIFAVIAEASQMKAG